MKLSVGARLFIGSIVVFVLSTVLWQAPTPTWIGVIFFVLALVTAVLIPVSAVIWIVSAYRNRKPREVVMVGDAASSIKQLADLRDSGVLTEDEFQAKKTALLDRI